MDRAYSALVEILGLHCECPIFGCLRFRRQCTNGKVSSSAKLVLKVPDECVKLTEYSVWADFMYHIQYTKPADYTMVAVDSVEQLSQAQLDKMILLLKKTAQTSCLSLPPSDFRGDPPRMAGGFQPPQQGKLLAAAQKII
mgnify:CR=1 FL=1